MARWFVRMPIKWLLFGAVCLFVAFPYPARFMRHIDRLRNLHTLVEPDAPEVAALAQELLDSWGKYQPTTRSAVSQPVPRMEELPADLVLRTIERFVYDKVVYAWDWDLWGNADYVPTIREMLTESPWKSQGVYFEDCDGRAVLAASLMKRMGYEASLVTDLRHVWVATPEGEWMGPGGSKSLRATSRGSEIAWGTVWRNAPLSLAYGVAVFPLSRELIILAVAYLLLLHQRMSWRWAALGGLLMAQGLLFMRCGEVAPAGAAAGATASWPAVVGLAHLVGGVTLLVFASRGARRGTRGIDKPLAVAMPSGRVPAASGEHGA